MAVCLECGDTKDVCGCHALASYPLIEGHRPSRLSRRACCEDCGALVVDGPFGLVHWFWYDVDPHPVRLEDGHPPIPSSYGRHGVPRFEYLPTQGRPERAHLYRWMRGEEDYVAGKFDDQRDSHDKSLQDEGVKGGFWLRQVVQYYDRAESFFREAKRAEKGRRRHLEAMGKQALAKAMMTAKGLVESSIRVYGPMPRPGMSSGYVEDLDGSWDEEWHG